MRLSSRQVIFAFAALAIACVTGLSFVVTETSVSAQGAGQAQAAPRQMAEQVYKNVQVLKGIPVDEFIGTMGVFSTSLTLCCGNCHTGAGTANPKWEDDPPRKRTARRMIEMVNKINKENFNGRQVVTCWTCHRGTLAPAVTAPLDFAYGEAVADPPDILQRNTLGGGKTLDQILDKYIGAIGGAAQVDKITGYVAKGTSILYGEVGKGDPAEIYAKAPNQLGMFVHQREGIVARTFDGTVAWFQLPLTVTPTYQLTGSLQESAKFEAAMAFPWKIKGYFNNWRVSAPQRIMDTPVDVIQGVTPTGMIGTLYFDQQTGLLKRMIRYATTAVGRMPTQIDYADYKPVNGVKLPFSFSYMWVSQREEWTLTEYQLNATIEATRFGKPPER